MRRYFGSAWAACFALAVTVLVLQFVPVFGFFLSFLNPSRWSILLVNLGFVLMAVEGFKGGARRFVRIAPAAWFGGYLALAAVSHLLASQFYAQIDRDNAAQKIRWDATSDAIALSHSWSDENQGYAFGAEHLVRDYPLSRAFDGAVTPAESGSSVAEAKSAASPYREVKIGIGDCPKGSMNQGPDGTRVVRYVGYRVQFASRLCISNREATAPAAMVRIVNRGIASRDLLLDRQVEPIDVTGADGRTYRLQAGWTRPLTWFPEPIIGCDWPGFTQRPIWCGIKFDRESARETGRTPEKVITSALGLSKMPLEKRFPDLSWE